MNTDTMIRNLRGLYEEHKNDHVDTFATNWSLVCWDVANSLEELEKKNEELQEQIPKWHLVADGDLPNDRQWYLAIFQEVDTGFVGLPYIADYLNGKHTKYTTDDGWIIRNCTDTDELCSDYYKKLKCIAWMELPKFESEVE